MNKMMSLHSKADSFEHAAERLTINIGAVADNWRLLAKFSGSARTSAVVKADAYGLGAVQVGKALERAGCDTFFVATPDEGVRLRAALPEARIFTLNGMWRGTEEQVFGSRLIPVIGSLEQLASVLATGQDYPYALYIDTGMNRLGLSSEETAVLANQAPYRPAMIMSHLACSDDETHPMNGQQRVAFQGFAALFEGVESSLSSSAGIFLGSDYHFDLTRPGIALYGGEARGSMRNPMQPVATAEARILQIRDVRKGDVASYGATHVFQRDSRVAIVGAGYADGWHRAMSGSGVPARTEGSPGAFGFLAGQPVPVVGRITMDLTTFDIGAIPENQVRTGDYIELFGNNIRLDETARNAGTIGYELLTSLGKRYERRFA